MQQVVERSAWFVREGLVQEATAAAHARGADGRIKYVALDAARRSLQMTEMASGHDNWSNKGSYLRSDARRHKGTSTLELEESGTKELERQLLYAKGDARQARSRMCLCLCPCLCSCLCK